MQSRDIADDEFAAKSRYWTSAIVNQKLGQLFVGDERRTAALWLAKLVGEDPGGDDEVSDLTTCRLMLAALKVSEGNIERLSLWVQAARNDPRDLIGAAEYRRELGGECGDAREADLAEYVAWVVTGLQPASEC